MKKAVKERENLSLVGSQKDPQLSLLLVSLGILFVAALVYWEFLFNGLVLLY